jgi:YD repeat-containing protein
MILVVAAAPAQITNVTDDTSTPIPGVGHDYIHLLSETVNPGNGSVSLRIQPPMPKGRGITVPFYIGYDSDSASHLIPEQGLPGRSMWASNNAYLSQGGWQYSAPMASSVYTSYVGNPNDLVPTTCYVMTNFMFTDPSGSQHPLNLASAPSVGPSPTECLNGGYLNPGGDGVVYAYLPQLFGGAQNGNDPNFSPLYVYTADGTVYYFPSGGGANGTLPTTIEDRNGNILVITDNNNASFTFTDTAGRVAVSANGMGPSGTTNTLTFSGLSYGVTWETVSASFTVSSTQIDAQSGVYCSPPPARSANLTTVSQISLPNGKFYKFYYGANNPHPGYTNPYGLLSEIDYPDGGWVRYTWKPSDTPNEIAVYPGEGPTGQSIPNGCLYEYQAPVIATRQVGFGGTSPSLTQAFTYSTTWTPVVGDPANWSQKNTSVCTTDDVRGTSVCTSPTSVPANAFLTTYSYTPAAVSLNNPWVTSYPPEIPLENVTTQYNWGSTTSVAQAVAKTWASMYELTSQTTVMGSLSSLITHTYTGPAQPVETDEYDYGATTPSRKTINTYQSFPKTYANLASYPDIVGILSDKPCKTVVTDGNGNTFSEIDFYYDGGTALCGTDPAPTTTSVPGLIAGTHDETNYPPSSSSAARGNVTQVVKWLNGGTSPTTTYTYDETGQTLTMTDPCGNGTCSDMSSGNHTTTYAYADSYSSGTPSGQTNTYLTKVTDPLNHITSYTYGYSDGQVTGATDANGRATIYKYNIEPSGCSVLDELDRLGEIDYPDGGVMTYCHYCPAKS